MFQNSNSCTYLFPLLQFYFMYVIPTRHFSKISPDIPELGNAFLVHLASWSIYLIVSIPPIYLLACMCRMQLTNESTLISQSEMTKSVVVVVVVVVVSAS